MDQLLFLNLPYSSTRVFGQFFWLYRSLLLIFQLPHCKSKSTSFWGCILLNISVSIGTLSNCHHYVSCAVTKACTAVKWTRFGNWPRLRSTQEWNTSHNSLSLSRLWSVSSIKWIAASHCCLSDIDRSSKALCWITRCDTEHRFSIQYIIYSGFTKKRFLTLSSFFWCTQNQHVLGTQD